MLYLTVALLLAGNCAIGTIADSLKVKFTPTGKDPSTAAEVDMEQSFSVKPIAAGKTVGNVMYFLVVQKNFPDFNVQEPLKAQGTFSGTLNGKPLNNLTVTERVWRRETGSSGELAKRDSRWNGTCGYYQDLGSTEPLKDSFYYFEAD